LRRLDNTVLPGCQGSPRLRPHSGEHPGRLTQPAPPALRPCRKRWQCAPAAPLQQDILQPSSCAKRASPERDVSRSAAIRAQAQTLALARFGSAGLERLKINAYPSANEYKQALPDTPVSHACTTTMRGLYDWVLRRGTLPEAVFADSRGREDGRNGDYGGQRNRRHRHLKPYYRVAPGAEIAGRHATAIDAARGGDDGAAIRIRPRTLPGTALSGAFAAPHVRRRVAESPWSDGSQGGKRKNQGEARGRKAASPAKILLRSQHPWGEV
jgi:hypothetical protein